MITKDPFGISNAVFPWNGPGGARQKQGPGRNLSGATAEEIAFCQHCPFPDCVRDCHSKDNKSAARETEQRVVELHAQKLTDGEIGAALGIGASTVHYHRTKRGLRPNRARKVGDHGG